jgi:hypothetical protein
VSHREKEALVMGDIHVYLENGFDHDRVLVSTGTQEHTEPDASTRYQVGLASVVDLAAPSSSPAVVRISLPERGLTAEAELDPAATPHVRVNVTDGALDVQPEASPPMYA